MNIELEIKKLEVQEKELDIELERMKLKRAEFIHESIMKQLPIKKEIAIIYRSKKQMSRIKKVEKTKEMNKNG